MDKSLLFFIIFALVAGNFLINSMEELDESDTSSQKLSSSKKNTYMVKDMSGDMVLSIDDLSDIEQSKAWNNSPVKNKVLNQFPNFITMKQNVDLYIGGNSFKIKLINEIDSVDIKYSSGEINKDQAINILSFK